MVGACLPPQTFCFFDFFQSLPQSSAVLQFETLLVSSDGFVVLFRTMKGSTLPSITFRPRRIDFNALEYASRRSAETNP